MKPLIVWMEAVPLLVLFLLQPTSSLAVSSPNHAFASSQQPQTTHPGQPSAAAAQKKSPVGTKNPKGSADPQANSDSAAPKPSPSYIQKIIPLDVPNSSTYLPPDASEIISLLGTPSPFTLKPGPGDSIIIYYDLPAVRDKDKPLLVSIENNISQLAAIPTQAIEISVANASALGDLLAAIKSLNYEDIKVEAVGKDKIRATWDSRVSPARFQAFVQDVHELSARLAPDSPVARIFFINAHDATTAVSGAPPPAPAKSPEAPQKSSGDSCSAAKPSAPPPCCPANQPQPKTAGAAPSSKPPSLPCPASAPQEPNTTPPDPKSASDSKPPTDSSAKPGVTVASLNDLLVFSDEHPGDDAAITERKRILAAVDFPRPEVIINTFSFQASSSNPDTLYQTASRVRDEMGKFHDGLQAGITRAWTYVEEQIAAGNFFETDFTSYLTKLYIADSQSKTGQPAAAQIIPAEKLDKDLSKLDTSERLAKLQGDRNAAGVCDEGKYCLGYTSLFHPLKPSLTDLLLAVISSQKPKTEIVNAIYAMEGKTTSGQWPSPLIPCPDHRCQDAPLQSCAEKYCKMPAFRTCEEQDEQELRSWNYASNPLTFIFPMNCFREAAALVFPEDDAANAPSLVGPLRAALADFLFHYKMSQQYPHEFSPYDLSRSAQELNSELNPLVQAFNRDLSAALRPLKDAADPRNTKGNGWAGFSGHGSTFINNGILTVRTISGKETTVDAVTQNFFDATNPPSITDVINSIGAAESNTPAVLKANLSADEAAAIIGTLNSVKPSVSKVGREFKIDITPRSLSGASAAELEINMTTQETADPSLYTNGKTDTDNLSRMAKHTTETKVRLESAKLFEISTFTTLLQRSRKNFPLLPPFVEIPYINSVLSLPLPGAKEYHISTAIMSAVVVPTAADLASGLVFTDDRVATIRDGARDGTCALTLQDSRNCVIRRAVSTSQWPAYSISDYHKAMIRCFSGGGFFAATQQNGATGCGSLQFDALPPEGH